MIMEERTSSIPVEKIIPNQFQTRIFEADDRIEKLAVSISEIGLIHPIIVRVHPQHPDMYELGSGHRRLEAFKTLGRDTNKKVRTMAKKLRKEALAIARAKKG